MGKPLRPGKVVVATECQHPTEHGCNDVTYHWLITSACAVIFDYMVCEPLAIALGAAINGFKWFQVVGVSIVAVVAGVVVRDEFNKAVGAVVACGGALALGAVCVRECRRAVTYK